MSDRRARLSILNSKRETRGFTLLEILLVVAAIAILAGIVIVAINPALQLAETRDSQRQSDVNTISSAFVQYLIKNGSYPTELNSTSDCSNAGFDNPSYGLCSTPESCDGIVLDDVLTPNFLPVIPRDPSVPSDTGYSGYVAFILPNSRIQVCAPLYEQASSIISVTR